MFAALAEAALDKVIEEGGADGRKLSGLAAFEQDNGGVDPGFGKKNRRRKGAFAVHGPEALHPHGERAVVGGVGSGSEAGGKFVLHSEDSADDGRARTEPVAEDG